MEDRDGLTHMSKLEGGTDRGVAIVEEDRSVWPAPAVSAALAATARRVEELCNVQLLESTLSEGMPRHDTFNSDGARHVR